MRFVAKVAGVARGRTARPGRPVRALRLRFVLARRWRLALRVMHAARE